MKDLSSYIPESLHTHQKRQTSCRLFLEDLAVVEPERDFRILASRGKDLPLGADFFKTCGVLSRDAALLRSHPQRQKRFLLPSKRGCVLMLGDLLSETGLFVGLLLLSRILSDLLAKHKATAFYMIVGLSIGSIVSMFLGTDMMECYASFAASSAFPVGAILVGVLLFAGGFTLAYLLVRYEKKHGISSN